MPPPTPGQPDDELDHDSVDDASSPANLSVASGKSLGATLGLFALIAAVLVPAVLLLGNGDGDADRTDAPTGSTSVGSETPAGGTEQTGRPTGRPTGPPTEIPSDLPTLPGDDATTPGDLDDGDIELPGPSDPSGIPSDPFPEFPTDPSEFASKFG